ncbi:MAG: hypothetical protein AM325_014460 [Candidatus Thorarchaeota archaeon SMTZ1-45]|nr:MAG: hypothetical protein AM325_15925 [Candidatus Thorarchaeota archaeon SMTZ1-45]
MTEIPMADAGATAGARPREVSIAGFLVLLESITGLIVGGLEYAIWENELSLLGAVLALIGFGIYFMILKQDYTGWLIAVIFNVFAIVLYAVGENWPGVGLSLICFFYLVQPSVRIHFPPS